MRYVRKRTCSGSAGLVLLVGLVTSAVPGAALAADKANAVVAETDLSTAFQGGLQLESAGTPIELSSSRLKLVLSDPRNKNQLLAILNDVGSDAPDVDDAGNDQSDFSIETVLTLKADGEEVSDTASCNWATVEKLQAECSVYDGGGGFLLRVESRGKSLGDTRWSMVIGEGLSVGFRAASTTTADGKRVEYILRINGREPVVAPVKIR